MPFWEKELGWKLKNLTEIAQEGQELNLPVSSPSALWGSKRAPAVPKTCVLKEVRAISCVWGKGDLSWAGCWRPALPSSQRDLESSLLTPVKIPDPMFVSWNTETNI